MSVQPQPPDHLRCQFLWKNGNQCREYRETGAEHGFCKYHHDRIERDLRQHDSWPDWVADEVLPPDTKLDSATAVNDTLTRLLRVALQGHIPVRHAGSLGYVFQHILTTVPGLQREAESQPKHAILGRDPDAAIAKLADTLHHAMKGASHASSPEAPEFDLPAQLTVPLPAPLASPGPATSPSAPREVELPEPLTPPLSAPLSEPLVSLGTVATRIDVTQLAESPPEVENAE